MRRFAALALCLLAACADDDTTAPSVDAGADADLCEEEVIIGIITGGALVMDDCTVANPDCPPRGVLDGANLREPQLVDCVTGAMNRERGDEIVDCYPPGEVPTMPACQE